MFTIQFCSKKKKKEKIIHNRKCTSQGHHPDIGAHEKFTNYEFNVKEFMRLMQKAVDHVKNHRGWQNLQENLRLAQRREEL